MEPKKTTSIPLESKQQDLSTSSFNRGWMMMKVMVIFFGILCLLIAIASMFFAYQANETASRRAYVVTDQGTMIAESGNNDLNGRKIEVESHIKYFFATMYSFDERTFKENIEKGSHLIGSDGKLIFQGYRDNNLLEDLVKSNGRVHTVVDSIWVDVNRHPYEVKAYARQISETPIGTVESNLWASMVVKNIDRSRKNVHGLLIDRFVIFNNARIQ